MHVIVLILAIRAGSVHNMKHVQNCTGFNFAQVSFLYISHDCVNVLRQPHGAMGWSAVCDCGIS